MHSPKSIHRSAPSRRRGAMWWLPTLLGALVLALAAPALATATELPAAGSASPAANPNSYECVGHISAGKAEAGGEGSPVQYEFSCNGPITGYQLQTQLPITGIEGQPLVANPAGQPLKEAFSCGGTFPGYADNCVGATTAEPNEQITGQFTVGWKLCTEPRVDPLLTVTYAYLEKGVVTQAISGPFDLGRPQGCPAPRKPVKDRLEAFQGSEPKAHKKHGKHGKHGKDSGKSSGKPKK